MTMLRNIIAAAAVAVAGAGSSVATAAPIPTDNTIPDVAERVVDSVVNISVHHEDKTGPADFDPFSFGGGEPTVQAAKGSGVIVTATGRILTNAHVVNGFEDIKVTLQDGTELDAKVVGKDTKADLAVIQLKGNFPKLKALPLGDSSTLRLGEIVLAIGDGMGVGKSVSMGIVSAKNRRMPAGQQIEEYEDFIQTDAAINPGNSGGALVNLRGELVGINTAIASRSGGYQGIGFAIPSNMARPIMEMLVRDGKVTRGYLGINIATVTPEIARQEKLGSATGVVIAGVEPKGPAAKAHLADGDVIVALNGTPMVSSDVLRNTIAMITPGTTVDLDVVHRDGSKTAVKAKLGELPDTAQVTQGQDPGFKAPKGWSCQRTPDGVVCQQSRRSP